MALKAKEAKMRGSDGYDTNLRFTHVLRLLAEFDPESEGNDGVSNQLSWDIGYPTGVDSGREARP